MQYSSCYNLLKAIYNIHHFRGCVFGIMLCEKRNLDLTFSFLYTLFLCPALMWLINPLRVYLLVLTFYRNEMSF